MTPSIGLSLWVRSLAVGAFFGFGCGGNSPEGFDPDRRVIPPEYHAPPAPCPRAAGDGAILAMPWRGRAQTFVEAGLPIDSLEIDYDVWPRPHVDRVFVGLDMDPLAGLEAVTLEGECPASVEVSLLREAIAASDAAPGEVARAVIIAEDDDRSRRGELFFTTGAGVAWVTLSEETPREGPTLLLFEPAWGEPRVALTVIEEDQAMPWEIRGLPEGPGTLVWVDPSGEPVRDAEAGVVYLPGGFAQDWIAFASRWRALSVFDVADASAGPLVLERGAADFEDEVLRSGLEWDGTRPLVLLGSDDGARQLPMDAPMPTEVPRQGDVQVPCDVRVRVHSPSFARVFATLDDGEANEVPFGEALDLTTTCDPDADTATLFIGVASRNRRDVRVVLESIVEEAGQ